MNMESLFIFSVFFNFFYNLHYGGLSPPWLGLFLGTYSEVTVNQITFFLSFLIMFIVGILKRMLTFVC
jgi:hypothetical protein